MLGTFLSLLSNRTANAVNQNGQLSREEPYSFWVQPTNSASAQWGLLANNKAVDAIMVETAGAFTAVDQNGNSIAFPATLPVGTILPISPSTITAGAANVLLLYK
jgi:hypothetical protein